MGDEKMLCLVLHFLIYCLSEIQQCYSPICCTSDQCIYKSSASSSIIHCQVLYNCQCDNFFSAYSKIRHLFLIVSINTLQAPITGNTTEQKKTLRIWYHEICLNFKYCVCMKEREEERERVWNNVFRRVLIQIPLASNVHKVKVVLYSAPACKTEPV